MRPPQFGADITNQAAVMHCTRMAGRAIIRVVGRCTEAQENNNLDLSECQLMQVPDAVYHLMRHTALKGCNLSSNVITKLPPKFAVKFSLITDLNLARNQMSRLPDELADLNELIHLDISHNSFTTLPHAVYKMPKLVKLSAHNNYIIDVEVERLQEAPSLQEVDLQNNPLSARTHTALEAVTSPHILVSVREVEDWEDLTV
ncbi:leucine-rich repeat-containing protein 20-like [Schistocerca americana]|uniref:leucine-rich repeat-containing protein 20-like n=1 Tax=Schistocerca americana TaxID=7009 RepID=UPI001F4F9AC4|nr:leucine-rich repeat-containing protein 20-like [Schistocerca americana]XP_047102472.1 leucine-rich repeat-containing protein 20-like [Schistocerca piceifrons]XP_049781874.1 leucine-rich repeat-containing protein 20-like isoform X1 [Schistocerca cancellata]XP_049805957.1 leucine-rich repeat-containing protein 20-like isoform X1 [Schistocerca nitens]XP_049844844.1 leucine-rich repeat-containing protein 20-like isoform X1 [Schistocerca gregaria]XP_049953496.1 leucine-rich repeat-containing pro